MLGQLVLSAGDEAIVEVSGIRSRPEEFVAVIQRRR